MRLTAFERSTIKDTILTLDPDAKIYLYGSRVHDHLRGGDIDLLVLSDKLDLSQKLTLLVEIKEQIGDQRIDLSVQKTSAVQEDAFIQSIFPTAVNL